MFGDGIRCAADKHKYSGRCSDRTIKFVRSSKRAKQHWGMLCGFQWPCRHCARNYKEPCPSGWSTDLTTGTDVTVCVAGGEYTGPCERRVDLTLFNAAGKAAWSDDCLAYWTCEE